MAQDRIVFLLEHEVTVTTCLQNPSPTLVPTMAIESLESEDISKVPPKLQIAGQASTVPLETYYGSYDGRAGMQLRIANGGAGQSGLIRALANAFIDYEVEIKNEQPFKVESPNCIEPLYSRSRSHT